MAKRNNLLDIDVTLHADTQMSTELTPERTTQKIQGKVKSAAIEHQNDVQNVPRAQVQTEILQRDSLDVEYDDTDMEREKQS